jgi:acyl dehydratase
MRLADVKPGTTLPPITKPPMTTRQLVQYAGASGDFNPIHYDDAFARGGGFPSVIAHGMLSMAFFGQLLTRSFGAASVKRLGSRFKAVTYPGDVITIEGTVTEVDAQARTALIQLTAKNEKGVVTLEGSATVELGREPA